MKNLVKTLFFAMVLVFAGMCAANAQIPIKSVLILSSSGYVKGDTTEVLKVYGPFQEDLSEVTVGVYYTKGASEDSTSTIQLLTSIDATAIAAGYGEVISTDATLQFGNSGASEYQEQTITLNGGQRYLAIKYVPVGTATDTTNVKPILYVK